MGTAEDLRAAGNFSVEAGLGITTAETTTLPYRLSPDEAMKIPKGADWLYTITWYREGDSPRDLTVTGYAATFTVRSSPTTAIIVSLTEGVGGITLGNGEGNILLNLSAAATAALNFVRAWAQLTVQNPAGRTLRLVEGFCDLVG